jgi:hypothetical protein
VIVEPGREYAYAQLAATPLLAGMPTR